MVETRGRPRSEASTQAVLAAAENLFGAKGYAGTSIEAIAKKAGVGKQTIYRWWPTKAHLASEIYEHLAPSSRITPNTGKLGSDIEAMLVPLFKAYDAGPAAALLSGLIAEAQSGNSSVRDFQQGFFDRRRAVTVSIFQKARDRGEMPQNADIDLLSDMLIGTIWMRLLAGHAPTDERFAKALTANLLAAAFAEPPSHSETSGQGT